MIPTRGRGRALVAVAVVTMACAALPAVASAGITIKSATLDGVTSQGVPAGSVMTGRATADVTSGSVWRATSLQFGTQPADCLNHSDKTAGTNREATADVTAPSPGTYAATIIGNEQNDCKGTAGVPFHAPDTLKVQEPGPNPNLPQHCGINVMLVLDKSGSIGTTTGATDAVKTATHAFINALSDTGSQVAIIDFSTTAALRVKYTPVTPATIASTFNPYINNQYKPSGSTNWESAFQQVKASNSDPSTPSADLVVFITDGDPNTATGFSGSDGALEAMTPAAAEADFVKTQKSHVFALGVGAAVTKPTSARRLTAVSGPDEYPKTNFSEADFTLVQNFGDLAAALRQVVIELCGGGSVAITKIVDEKGDGTGLRPDPGWSFTADVTESSGSYTWVDPAPPPKTGEQTKVTDSNGIALFQWRADSADATSTVKVTEPLKPGYTFAGADCRKSTIGQSGRRRTVQTAQFATASFDLTMGPSEYWTCTVTNRIIAGTIEIEKSANPQSAQAFQFSGSGPLGDFTLVDDAANPAASSKVYAGLAPGTYTVQELVPTDWAFTNVTCSDPTAVAIDGPRVTITLAEGKGMVCTYSDTRTDPPAPPPIVPVTPTPPTPPTTPPTTPPAEAVKGVSIQPNTRLRIVKTAPRVARVGERIRFALTVTNVGSVSARNVMLADHPPPAVTLAALASERPVRVVDGNAIWRLGTLAPGASRTVRGSVRIKAGTPGLKRNLALVGAANARLAIARADTRVVGQRSTPSFTG